MAHFKACEPAMKSDLELKDATLALANSVVRFVDLLTHRLSENLETVKPPPARCDIPRPEAMEPLLGWMTKREAAAHLQVSVRTIDNLLSARKLPFVRIGRSVRIPRRELDLQLRRRLSHALS